MKAITFISLFIIFLLPLESKAQTFQWAFSAGDHVGDYNNNVVTDSEGNVYTLGFASGHTIIGDVYAPNAKFHITKQNKDGVVLWCKFIDHNWGMAIYDLALHDNKLFIAGKFGDEFKYDGVLYSAGERTASNLLCLDPEGEHLWSKGFEIVIRTVFANNDGLFLSGPFMGSLRLDNYFFYDLEQKGGYYILKLNENLEVVWGTYDYGIGNTRIVGDQEGNLFVSGHSGSSLYTVGEIAYPGRATSFIAKYDPDGKPMWVDYFYSPDGRNNASDLVIDNEGNAIAAFTIVGESIFKNFSVDQSGTIVLKYNTNGRLLWKKPLIGTEQCKLSIVSDNAIMASYSKKGINVIDDYPGEELTLTSGSLLIVKFHPLGFQQWAKVSNGTVRDMATGINNSAVMTGLYHNSSIDFDGHIVNNNSGNNDPDMFTVSLADLTALYCPEPTVNLFCEAKDFCQGDSVTIQLEKPFGSFFRWTLNGHDVIGSDSIIVSSQPGQYQLHINENTACPEASDIITINEHAYPNAAILNPVKTILCPNDTIVLTTSQNDNYTFEWFFNNVLLQEENHSSLSVVERGKYNVTVSNSFCASTDSVVITSQVLPIVKIDKDTLVYTGHTVFIAPQINDPSNLKWYYNFDKDEFSRDPYIYTDLQGNYLVVAKNDCGIDVDNILVINEIVENIDEEPTPTSLSLFPNPSSEFLTCQLGTFTPGPVVIKITDLKGATVFFNTFELRQDLTLTLNTKQFPAGNYIISISNKEMKVVEKIVVL